MKSKVERFLIQSLMIIFSVRSCKNPKKTLTEHLVIDTPLNKCNDTIAYDCDDKCWKLHGKD